MKPKIIVILGPTAIGKSDLAVEIAKVFNGEIISADSRQVYKKLDIGTGKITKKEMRGVPHHCLDIVDPKKTFSVADFKDKATTAIKAILEKGKTVIGVFPFSRIALMAVVALSLKSATENGFFGSTISRQ